MIEKTVLDWTYQPTTYFEAPYSHSTSDYTIAVADGKVTVTLAAPQDPVRTDILRAVESQVGAIFAGRQLQTHQPYKLAGPATCQQHANGHKDVAISLGVSAVVVVGEKVDLVMRGASGEIIQDTRAESIAEDARFLDSLTQKSPDPLLQSLLRSYSAAVNDPANELVHLYEIRDARVKRFGNETAARSQLSISKTQWQRLGFLANDAPLQQGRHRGKSTRGTRAATQAELDEVRRIVRGWIEKYLRSLP
jgi:hypothetical protein